MSSIEANAQSSAAMAFDSCDGQEGGDLVFYAAMRGSPFPKSCAALQTAGYSMTGLYTIDPDGPAGLDPFQGFCDMETDGGGWT